MTATDWIAIIGALAWLPPIVGMIKQWISQPNVRIITQPTPEIGFTTFGPICNIRLAFSVKNKDLVVTGLKLVITHESGESRSFEWRGITQKMGQMTFPETGPVPFEKELNVLAMKLIERDIEERFVRFQELTFLQGKANVEKRALKKLAYLKQQGNLDLEKFLKSEEMADVYSNVKQAFSWKAGNYSVRFVLESPEKFEVSDDRYEFSLTPVDIEQLEENKKNIEQSYANEINPPTNAGKPEPIRWNWSYPDLRKAT
jgi:hypothetical protein